jgi:hypothetical protein
MVLGSVEEVSQHNPGYVVRGSGRALEYIGRSCPGSGSVPARCPVSLELLQSHLNCANSKINLT